MACVRPQGTASLSLTLDNQRIIIPNGLLSNGCLTNLNAEPHRRVDMVFGIIYGDDVLQVKRILQEVIALDSRVLAEPASEVYVKEHAESSIHAYPVVTLTHNN